jgi:hypothetical protein
MRVAIAVVLASCLPLSGCLEVEHTVRLAPDGSGSQSVRLELREATLAELQRLAPAAQLGAAANPAAIFDRAVVEQDLRAAGLELASFAATKAPGKRCVQLEARFPNFAALQKSPLAGNHAEWQLERGPRPETAKLTLYPQGKAAWTEARAKADAMPAQADPVAAEFFRKRQQQLDGLDICVRFQLPGDVLMWTRNLEKTGDREVTARITAAQIQTPEDLVRRLAPRFEVIFAANGCSLPLP